MCHLYPPHLFQGDKGNQGRPGSPGPLGVGEPGMMVSFQKLSETTGTDIFEGIA